jgi:pimeloyl-ACP methyl ester carboxylesterase
VTTATIHFFSQLVYLNLPPQKGKTATVGETIGFYLHTQAGQRLLEKRFGHTPRELESWKEFLESAPQELLDWQIVDVLDDNAPQQTGFYGCTFLSPQGERLVAFRGSEMLGNPNFKNDYLTDFSLILCDKTPQQKMVDRYWRKYGDKLGEIWVTGHSLGGNLAAYAAMSAPDSVRQRIQKAVAFNAPGFCKEFLKRYQKPIKELEGRLVLYQNKYDMVSSLLEHPVKAQIVASRFDPTALEHPTLGDVMYPHSNFLFERDEAGEMLPDPSGEKSHLCQLVHRLSDMVLSLPLPMRRELMELTLHGIYDSPDGPTGRKAALDAASRYLNRHLTQNGVKSPAMVAYGAGLLLEHNPIRFLAKLDEDLALPGALARTLLLLLYLLRP